MVRIATGRNLWENDIDMNELISHYDNLLPCNCIIMLSQQFVDVKGSDQVEISYWEHSCSYTENDVNAFRKVPRGFKCSQILSKKKLYRDIKGNPIEPVEILYNAGCELRCIYPNCGRREIPYRR